MNIYLVFCTQMSKFERERETVSTADLQCTQATGYIQDSDNQRQVILKISGAAASENFSNCFIAV